MQRIIHQNLILILNNDDYYEILTGINVVDNQITLYLQPQSNTKILSVIENINLKTIIDTFRGSYYFKYGNQKIINAYKINKIQNQNIGLVFDFILVRVGDPTRISLFNANNKKNSNFLTFDINSKKIFYNLNIDITYLNINFRLIL